MYILCFICVKNVTTILSELNIFVLQNKRNDNKNSKIRFFILLSVLWLLRSGTIPINWAHFSEHIVILLILLILFSLPQPSSLSSYSSFSVSNVYALYSPFLLFHLLSSISPKTHMPMLLLCICLPITPYSPPFLSYSLSLSFHKASP